MISVLVKSLREAAERNETLRPGLTLTAADTIETLAAKLGEKNLYGTDWVAVTRCKDCKHYKTKFCAIDTWTEDITIYKANDNDYCSRAEPKEE